MDQDKKSKRKRITRKRKSKSQSISQPVRFEEIEAEDGSKKMVEVRRRRRRRSKQPKKEKENRIKLARRFLIIGIVSLLIIIFSFYFFMITWIGGQGFRNNVSDKVSEIIDQDVSFGEFSLKGLNLRSKGFKIDSVPKDFLLLEANLELLQPRIHPRSFFSSDWSMGNVQSLKGELLFGKDLNGIIDIGTGISVKVQDLAPNVPIRLNTKNERLYTQANIQTLRNLGFKPKYNIEKFLTNKNLGTII